MAVEIKAVNGLLVLTPTNVRLGNISDGIAENEAVSMGQYNTIDTRVTALEQGTQAITRVELEDGSETAPSLTFSNDTNTGLYRIGADSIGITNNGSQTVSITTAGVSVVGTLTTSTTVNAGTIVNAGNGTLATPAFAFTSDSNTGLYRVGADNIGIVAGGTNIINVTTSGAAVTGAISATTTVTATTLVFAGNGAVGAPAYSFVSDTDSGLYRIGADNLGIAIGGNNIQNISSTGLVITGLVSASTVIRSGDGAVGTPAHSFISDTDTGLYSIAANNAGFSCNGAKVLDIGTGGLTVTGIVSASTIVYSGDGAVGTPAYSFISDTDTGIYRIGANNMGVACNAAKVLDISTSGLDVTGYSSGLNKVLAVSASGAISVPTGNMSYFITKAGVADLTIIDPTATTHDGLRLSFISATANAHTLSNAAGSGFNAGGAASDIGTYGGAKGDNIVIEAYQGKWFVVSKINVTLA